MAGTLTISTLCDGTNSTSATNCIQGSAKAWVRWTGTTGAVVSSYNVSSVTRTSSGFYTVNLTNAMASANYSGFVSASPTSGGTSIVANIFTNTGNPEAPTASAFKIALFARSDGSNVDATYVNASIFL